MQRLSDTRMQFAFLGWQCRIRQIAMREHAGQPLLGMRPKAMLPSGETVLAAMTVLIVPREPREAIAFLRFQTLKTRDPGAAREAALSYLSAEYYQSPAAFSPDLTAVFPAAAAGGARLLAARRCLLEFEQWRQSYRLFASVRALPRASAARAFALAHNRIFNPNLPADALVLAFKPDWKTAQADPLPTG